MDFLRAIAILSVVLAHTVLSYGAPEYLAPLQFGGTGVQLFFVLSGWLLGGLLFKEVEKQGTVDIKRFWLRRWMRTLPAYYVVLIFSVSQRMLTKDNVEFPWQYFVFLQNYDYPLHFFSISWSLCVEEQFYLFIAPFITFLALLHKRLTTLVLILLLFLPLLFRELGWYHSINETHVSLDSCVMGVFLAHIYHQYKSLWQRLSKFMPYMAAGVVILYLFFYVARYNPQIGISDPDQIILAIMFGCWVFVANINNYWRSALYLPGANYIATRSYALYLLHPEILALLKRYLINLPFALYLILALIGSLLIAEVLYRLVEKPVMDARERYSFSQRKLG